MRPLEVGRKDGAVTAAADLPVSAMPDSYFNDAGARMEYTDGFREGWRAWKEGQGAQIPGHQPLIKGSHVRFLNGGRVVTAKVTMVYLDLGRFDAEVLELADGDTWRYPTEDGRKVWGYLSDVLEVTKF